MGESLISLASLWGWESCFMILHSYIGVLYTSWQTHNSPLFFVYITGSVSDDYLEYMLWQLPTNVTGWICHTLVTSTLLKVYYNLNKLTKGSSLVLFGSRWHDLVTFSQIKKGTGKKMSCFRVFCISSRPFSFDDDYDHFTIWLLRSKITRKHVAWF